MHGWSGRAAVPVLLAGLLAAGGCGSRPVTISRTASPAAVKARLLRIMQRWGATQAVVEETATGGPEPGTMVVRLDTAGGGAIRAQWTGPHGRTHLLVADDHQVVRYTAGAGHYTVEPAGSTEGDPRWLVGTGLVPFLNGARPLSVAFAGHTVTLRCQAALPGGPGIASLVFDPGSGRPLAWSATWTPAGSRTPETLHERVESFSAGSGLPAGTFEFTPPAGVQPAVEAQAPDGSFVRVTQGVVVPPAGSGLTLNTIITSGGSPPVLMLAYAGPDGRPLLVTEFAAATGPADPGGSGATPITIAGLPADTATLATGQAYIGFTWHGTRVWLEGTSGEVPALANAWLTALNQGSPGPAPASGTGNRPA
ncbi:MAG: hypothetical protein OWV35_08640 [Firmicutes bacterium]|nr:hypothetical protein [Bacillota bacterium]